jgi:hypothetical protein
MTMHVCASAFSCFWRELKGNCPKVTLVVENVEWICSHSPSLARLSTCERRTLGHETK